MEMLTDDMLLESYRMATVLHLDQEFIGLLLAEIHRRDLKTHTEVMIH
ncbi:developmental checkpoint coupling sporulation initiation to replication initiation [Fontibacillus solani]|uniref:Sporulation inhibitor A n=2 Tax=Fontibacillus TaxID=995014 RepID=A0A1G7IKV8_9BACL|nr:MULTISPECIES: sporulation histidine kinase inhibitor Sda [Fontibacillus]MBA9084443.1 developmental checkpoint coupling sporulation initiation to replication initiation [Fontibacillus solani]SDF13380.1 Sporulation inhibitor A [Fontibacillus panacisegetis]